MGDVSHGKKSYSVKAVRSGMELKPETYETKLTVCVSTASSQYLFQTAHQEYLPLTMKASMEGVGSLQCPTTTLTISGAATPP